MIRTTSLLALSISLTFFFGCKAGSIDSRSKTPSVAEPQIMLLVFDVKHVPETGKEEFLLHDRRTRVGTLRKPSSQELAAGKLVVNYLDTMQQVRRWEVVDDPLATEYEYPAGADSGFGHTIVRRDSSSLALIVPYDPLIKQIRFETIGAGNIRTTLSTTFLAVP